MTVLPSPTEPEGSGAQASPDAVTEAHPALRLATRRALYDELAREDSKLRSPVSMAEMYLGALISKSQDGNPEYLVQSAQSIRELMEKMPRYNGIRPVASLGLTVKVKEVVEVWARIDLAGEDGELRTRLREAFHVTFEAFARWFTARDEPKKEMTGKLFGKIDQRKMRLPEAIEKHQIATWREYEDYFIQVSHHRSTTTEDFDRHLVGFEEFALAYFRPRTFEDRAEIRKLTEEADRA